MDTTCNAVISVNQIDCSSNNISDLTGIRYFDNLSKLYCYSNQLTNLSVLPNSLTYLYCFSNQLTNLPVLPNSLFYLYCYSNQLNNLPALPNSLKFLSCENNQLSSLPALPNSLLTIYCGNNPLNTLPTLPNSLTWLDCRFNQLSSLPSLPNSLARLYCYNNQINSFPALPNSLTHLDCSYNQLNGLPTLPNSLISLYCPNNQLSSLPALPDSLELLNCSNNPLNSLLGLPNSLLTLYCLNDQLSSISALPNSLQTLDCSNNRLSSLPELPDSLFDFHCIDNPYLFCLPRLKQIKYFYFYNTGITCLPNYPQNNVTSIPPLSTYPLCDTSLFNLYGCGSYWNISGKVYIDSNANCLYDAGENTCSNLKVQLYQNGVLGHQENALPDGSYAFVTYLDTYTYTIDTVNIPFVLVCPDSGYYTSVITASDSSNADMNFGLRCKQGFDLMSQSISAWRFRPGNITPINITCGDASNFYGAHCAAGTSGNVQLIINGSAHYDSPASGAVMPTTVSNDTVTWSVTDFGTVNFFSDFNINVVTDTNAVLGSQICFTLIVNPIVGDNNPANNILTHCFTVVSSFDPNEKEVYPAGNIDTSQKWLTYTIHFQNTGTAEAQHIYVTDTLDSNVDAASFQLLAYSHQPMVQIKENAVRFNFPNINLPDSNTNELLSHGYVQYKVKLKDNLPVGTNISNTAFIYFDFNAPVVTNTTTNTIALATGVNDVRFERFDVRLFPNPTNDLVNIAVDETMAKSKLTIADITGRKITVAQIENRVSHIETSAYPNGVYFVAVENERGRVTKKLVIQR